MKDILKKQKEFEKILNIPIDTVLESERNELSEIFILKTIEELIEVRREFPSQMNKWSKTQTEANLTRIKIELADVFLFFTNLLLTWKIDWEEFIYAVKFVQNNNFIKVKERMMKLLNEEILVIPGHVSGVGNGCINPKYIFIGQNPGKNITHGYKFWSNPNDGSSKILLPILEELGILDKCYFTNIVKCTTENNAEPTQDSVDFWKEYLLKELKILHINNEMPIVIGMGKFVNTQLPWCNVSIRHPSYALRTNTQDRYKHEIKTLLGL